jgi:predicted component of type VI protein secretion system
MTQTITLRVLQGADRGRVFRTLATPVTIGREEGNLVQLNDERISRFHVKIQEDDGRLVVTDLDSTNGTKVNGQVCSLKILRNGDTIAVGRTVLLVRSHAEGEVGSADELPLLDAAGSSLRSQDECQQHSVLPTLPRGMGPGQSAELRELLDHIHVSLRAIVDDAIVNEKEGKVLIDQRAWEYLLAAQANISAWIRCIEDPQASQT